MKKIFLTAAAAMLTVWAQAQQLPLYSQYLQNPFVINPAVAGTMGHTDVRTVLRNQWTGLDEGLNGQFPKTTTLSFNTGWDEKNIGVGAYVFSDKIGPVSKTGLSGTYAYHFKTGKESMLSFGLSGMIFLYKLATSDLHFDVANNPDNVLLTGNFKAYSPNVGFGAYYKGKNGFVGLSVPEMIASKLSVSQDFFVVQEKQHYFVMGGATLKLSDNMDLDPSFLIKYVGGAPVQFDVNVAVEYKKMLSLGASYRPGAALVLLLGYKYKDGFRFGYSYDITTSELSTYAKGTHELMLGWVFNHKKKEDASSKESKDIPPPQEIK